MTLTTESSAPYLQGLNDAQRAAVEALDGAVLLLAGAGTGKTRALTTRLAHLLWSGRARPGEILAVTFTNKAAREMKERVAALLGRPSVEGWWLGTFHALAARILRQEAEAVGLKSNFTILDSDDQLRLIKQVMAAEGVNEKSWPAKSLRHLIERWKDKGFTPDRVPSQEVGDFAQGRSVALYAAYQERLRTLNACDFGDLLLHNLTLFQTRPDVAQRWQQRFRYLLVDEYQDTNVAQYLWLRLLALPENNICCVGDDDQSIYGWRGAQVENILRFESDFPDAKVIRLERNYRSTPAILGAASGLIARNEGRLGKTLWTEGDAGEPVRVRGLWDGEAEARFVGQEIEALQREGHSLGEMAILVRTGAQTREFEERFVTLGLPYRVIGGPRFYERLEVRDALAYLRLLQSPDDDLAFERICNKPRRGLGEAALRKLHSAARSGGTSLYIAAHQLVGTDELRAQTRRPLKQFVESIERWRDELRTTSHPELAERVLEESGYLEMWREDRSIEAPGRLENLKALIEALAEFETLAGFLEHVSLVMENLEEPESAQVTLMTLHAAKGLEFDTVFLPGWEEGLFPNQRALDEQGNRGLEEERRLAYVGLTRARKRAIVSFAANRRLYGSWAAAIPSRFVDELPEEHCEQESDKGIYGAAHQAWGGGNFGGFQSWGDTRYSPGMERARARRERTGTTTAPVIDAKAQVVESTPRRDSRYRPGSRVFHQKFGYGTVSLVEGERLTIAFDHSGEKKVVAGFVTAAEDAN
ncbi:ATP-dependent helicase [Aquibaculum arenosum]|uniref:DNA 3'-5' helicase n=1 Tax=Aquibaculum arenosum TaxID=3032591 RepID=A0ABT5YN76_9PROT|nr:UvrD-helicase domain-containing protein [Fodinicurvata sp. CAU 1616]MDF2096273.1 UvrD-helicase domain-containing protein [Fodinicurvata sp. CAU 1616]